MKTEMFPFTRLLVGSRKKKRLPVLSDLSEDQRRALPGQCTHLEWVYRQAFGKDVRVLLAWIVGCKKPVKWDERLGSWVDDSVYK